MKRGTIDLSLLDEKVESLCTKLLYTFPDCTTKTVEELRKPKLDAWNPDAVVWGTFVNDLEPTYLLYDKDGSRPIFVGTSVPEGATLLPEALALWLVPRSALFRRVQGAAYARYRARTGIFLPSPLKLLRRRR